MKKIIVGLFLVIGLASMAEAKKEIRFGYDLGGKYYYDYGSEKLNKKGLEYGFEYRYEFTPNFELGGGLGLQFHKVKIGDQYFLGPSGKTAVTKNYNSAVAYITGKYSFPMKTMKTYIKGDFGISNNNINYYKETNGIYYGAGVGISQTSSKDNDSLNIDLMYKVNTGKLRDENLNKEIKADYKRVTLGIGYSW